jgi:hypothetical protein
MAAGKSRRERGCRAEDSSVQSGWLPVQKLRTMGAAGVQSPSCFGRSGNCMMLLFLFWLVCCII